MKTKKLYLFALLLCGFSLVSCHDDDDNNQGPVSFPVNQQLEGKWHLTNVSGGIGGTTDNYSINEIVWDFDTETHTVTVANANTDPQKVDFFNSGTYSYTFNENTTTPQLCLQNLAVNGTNLGCYSFEAATLTLSQIEADGYSLQLIREPEVVPFN